MISPSKETILKKIRKALTTTTPLPFPKSEGSESVFHPITQEPEVEFAERFSALQGRFVYCINEQELAFQLNSLVKKMNWEKVYCLDQPLLQFAGLSGSERIVTAGLADCDVSITGCECLVARTGSVVLSSAQLGGRTASVYAPIHICIATTDQLKSDLREALQFVKDKYKGTIPSLLTFATGPSRTADIEKTLVVGVHGPREVYVFLVDS